MTDMERIDDAYERIDIDTDEILAFYDGERVERCLKSIWDSTVTMHQIATVALKENAKLRELVKHYADEVYETGCFGCPYVDEYQDKCDPFKLYPYTDGCRLFDDMRKLGIEVPHD